ncbi:MAG TPA: thioesterase family protein [Acidimicrobiales bacterium]|nr:thioesterase family protein [Acidimicrobiales bacterium]
MDGPNILTDTTPSIDAIDPTLTHSVITDAWGLFYAQGGVVMAAALRAMTAVLDRDDFGLVSASATFCRPVACGPVQTRVDVLHSGRRGAQVVGSLRDPSARAGAVSVAVSAVFCDPGLPGPSVSPLSPPPELQHPPAADAAFETMGNAFPLGFLDNTQWQTATQPDSALPVSSSIEQGAPRLALWFRFKNPPTRPEAPWEPALLPIPGDALGSALIVAVGDGKPVGSVSLQIDLQVHAPMTGAWIGIDSTCTHVGNGLATGVLHLWSDSGVHVATLTQTAMLRSFDE